MVDYDSRRVTIKMLAVISVIMFSIVVIVVLTRDDSNLGDFSSNNNIRITEDDLTNTNSEKYTTTRRELERDFNLKKELIISDFKSNKFEGRDLQNILWNFIFSFDLNNQKYISNLTGDYFCLTRSGVNEAFNELYGIDIKDYLDTIQGYKNYVSMDRSKFCFNYKNISNEYNNEIKLGISTIKLNGTVLIANVYVFEYYTLHTEAENNSIKVLENYINSKNYTEAANVVRNNLFGKVTLKQVEFKVNKRAKYFKYQILSTKNIV